MNTPARRTLWALALQCTALAVLAAALLGVSWLDARSRPRLVVLVDRSASMPRGETDAALAEVLQAVRAAGAGDATIVAFAARPRAPAAATATLATATTTTAPTAATTAPTKADPSGAPLDTSATDLEAALDAALALHARTPLAGAVMISDGLATRGDTERALRAWREAGLPLAWRALGRAAPEVRIDEVLAPARTESGRRALLTVKVSAPSGRDLRLRASARGADGEVRTAVAAVAADGRAAIELDTPRAGALVVDLAVEDAASGRTLATRAAAAAIDVGARAALLYVQGAGTPGALARSLVAGGWPLTVVDAARLDALAGEMAGYEAVVLDDVAVGDAGPRAWAALVDAVRRRGTGLLVLGGEHAFARGGYRGSALESVLPLLSEPAALDRPAAVLFLVDKSGSMGEGSGGVDRFQLAQRAVLDTARSLGERDALGLVLFDIAPRVLLPLAAAPAGIAALERPWPATPNGGTRLAPAIDAALSELERAGAARRLLVLVTDGFVDEAPLTAVRARLERAHVETLALAVGPDADAAALRRLVGERDGTVLRVAEAAELPAVMKSGLERRRARVERGPFAVVQRAPLPFSAAAVAAPTDWPAVDAYSPTRPRPEATVAVASERGDPLLAWQREGPARVAALASGLGRWTPRWLAWREWPQLAGGLADWVSGRARDGVAALAVAEVEGGLQIDAELAGGGAEVAGPAAADAIQLRVDTPAGPGQHPLAEPVAPGRWRARVPDAGPGLYTVLASTPLGTQRRLVLRQPRAEDEAWGINPALARWQAEALLRPWSPQALARLPAPASREPWLARPLDRSLLGLALALFVAGVLVDRAALGLSAWRARVGRLVRARARRRAC